MRIISLVPDLTELVCRLGSGSELIGITDFCVHPFEIIQGIEKVGGTKNPDARRILALKPDLILLNQEENRLVDHEAFMNAGIRCWVAHAKTLEETEQMVRELGDKLQHADQAAKIIAEIRNARRQVR